MDNEKPKLEDVSRRLGVIMHDLKELQKPVGGGMPPANIAEVTLAFRNIEVANFYVGEAKKSEQV